MWASAIASLAAESTDIDDRFEATMQPFLKEYCIGCHGGQEEKGDRRFDRLSGTIDNDDSLVNYQDIVDQLNLGAMPPDDARQPPEADRQKVVAWMTNRLSAYHEQQRGAGEETILRRLNRREYENTIRDLLHLNMVMFDPTIRFPRDQTIDHLDNVGETLVMSGFLLQRYLEVADQVVAKALFPRQQPAVEQWTFRDDFRQQPEIDQVHGKTNGFSHMTLYDVVGADKHEGAYGPILNFADGVPHDGVYEIRFNAEALHRQHPYDPEFLGTDPDEPLRLGIVAGNRRAGNLHLPQPVEPLLAELELADQRKWYTAEVWLDKGFTPRFTFRNGLMDVRNLWNRLIKNYRDQFPQDIRRGIVAARFNAIKHGKLPQIHIHEIEIRGPLHEHWPTDSQVAILGKDWDPRASEAEFRERIGAFASRAYRRPATEEQVDHVMQLIAAQKKAGRSNLQAYADGIKAILSSPNFLYLHEPTTSDDPSFPRRLDAFALASRLSYFLWSSMPDRELIALASSARLSDPGVLRQQARRMLDDPKSDALVDGLLGSWLGLTELGATPPDRGDFRDFYHYDLDTAMRRETFLFTRHLLDENLEIANFLDSDFTFVNRPLARHYGLPEPAGYEFQKVSFNDFRRGGLLGQASILTLTANGIDTSPIVRGVWLLENLLATPPSPPPPDVEPLDPDTRGTVTIRDQLEKHRENPGCYECHRRIDPPGFALENFDPIGHWRDHYGPKTPIDSSGEMPDGESFENIVGFKRLLSRQLDQVAFGLTQKLLSYAIGRQAGPMERPTIDRILDDTREDNYRFRDLIEEVVLSESFASP